MLRIWIFAACIAGLYALGHTRVEDKPDTPGPRAVNFSLSQTRIAPRIPSSASWQVVLPGMNETVSGFRADPVHARPATPGPHWGTGADLAANDDIPDATAYLARPRLPR
ncbi:hypothetical protein LV82_00169 [Albidovulum inexpectatum]|uniref:Uncharacterized protein n=1 Tax=Albidovulum inexpectatum TaxID=196587 RepID=A0A2S5JLE3_9RHOB|nr:hypothetical protein [Albidovulum inexpectatum]PPB82243.1 hypothetical protein LV82_00169 [Albidovulum inexpectatum]